MKTVSQACTAAPTDIANSHGRTINRTTAPTATKGAGPARGPGRAAGSPCHTRAKGWTGRLQVVWSFG
jgi:hypothetical protein